MNDAQRRDEEDERAVLHALAGLRLGLTAEAIARVTDMPRSVVETTVRRLLAASRLAVETRTKKGRQQHIYHIARESLPALT